MNGLRRNEDAMERLAGIQKKRIRIFGLVQNTKVGYLYSLAH